MILVSQNGCNLCDMKKVYVNADLVTETIRAIKEDGKYYMLGQYKGKEHVYYVLELLKKAIKEGDLLFEFPKDDDL